MGKRLRALSERETLIVVMLSEGMQHKVIGRKLGISHRTVEAHRASAMRKLGVNTTIELIMRVMMGKT